MSLITQLHPKKWARWVWHIQKTYSHQSLLKRVLLALNRGHFRLKIHKNASSARALTGPRWVSLQCCQTSSMDWWGSMWQAHMDNKEKETFISHGSLNVVNWCTNIQNISFETACKPYTYCKSTNLCVILYYSWCGQRGLPGLDSLSF